MSDTEQPAPTEGLIERAEAAVEGAVETVAKDIGYPWWVTSDPNHPVNVVAPVEVVPPQPVDEAPAGLPADPAPADSIPTTEETTDGPAETG